MPTRKPRSIDANVSATYKELHSKFALVTKLRANIWLTTAVTLFVIGFIAGLVYIVDYGSSNKLQGIFSLARFIPGATTTVNNQTIDPRLIVLGGTGNGTWTASCTRDQLRAPRLEMVGAITNNVITLRATNLDPAGCGKSRFDFETSFNNRVNGSYVTVNGQSNNRLGDTPCRPGEGHCGDYSVTALFVVDGAEPNHEVGPGGTVTIRYKVNPAITSLSAAVSGISIKAYHNAPDFCYSENFNGTNTNSTNPLCDFSNYDSSTTLKSTAVTVSIDRNARLTSGVIQPPVPQPTITSFTATKTTLPAACSSTGSTTEALTDCSTRFNWTCTNSTSYLFDPGTVTATVASPTTMTGRSPKLTIHRTQDYTLTCSGAAGTTPASQTRTVTVTGTTPPNPDNSPPEATLLFNDNETGRDQLVFSCRNIGNSGTVSGNGFTPVGSRDPVTGDITGAVQMTPDPNRPNANKTYTLFCTKGSGVRDTATVVSTQIPFNPPSQEPRDNPACYTTWFQYVMNGCMFR